MELHLSISQIQNKYGIPAVRIRKLLINHPNYLGCNIRDPDNKVRFSHYLIPESQIDKLMFLKGGKRA